jgi:hypothetical protein
LSISNTVLDLADSTSFVWKVGPFANRNLPFRKYIFAFDEFKFTFKNKYPKKLYVCPNEFDYSWITISNSKMPAPNAIPN